MRRFVVTVLVAMLVAISGPASAAGPPLQLSRDGVAWSGSLAGPLFDESFRWVPGDVETRSFWVRNASTNAKVTVTGVGVRAELVESGDFVVRVRMDSGPWRVLSRSTSIVMGALAAGATRRFDVEAAFATTSSNSSKKSQFPLSFTLDLTEAFDGADPVPGSGEGFLPRTGAFVDETFIHLAAAAIAAGFFILAVARRRRPTREDTP